MTAQSWTPRSAVRRARDVLYEQGPSGVAFGMLAHTFYRRLWIFELPLTSATPEPSVPDRVEVTELDAAQLGALQGLRPSETPLDVMRTRMHQGHRCWVARIDGRVVAMQWAAAGTLPGPWLGVDLPLAPDESSSYDSFTAPSHRGRGLGVLLRAVMARALGANGHTRLLATVLPENLPAVKLVERLGYARIGTVRAFTFGPVRRSAVRMAAGRRPPGQAAEPRPYPLGRQRGPRTILAKVAWRAHPAQPRRTKRTLDQTQWWSTADLQAVQLDALNDVLQAARSLPAYRRRLDEAGLGTGRLGELDDLRALAPMTPGDLERTRSGGRGRSVQSSGTTGSPRRALWTLETMRWADAIELRAREWLGVQPTDRRLWLCCSDHSALRRTSLTVLNTRLLKASLIDEPAGVQQVLRLLQSDRPAVVQGVSNALYTVARALLDSQTAVRPTACWSAANHLLPHYRTTIEAAFQAPVLERYAAAEVGLIASMCPERSLHIQAEHLLVEVVGGDGRRAAPGEPGTVLVTTLRNRRAPLLRYRLGDLAVAGEQTACPCGRGLPMIAAVAGRETDQLRRADGTRILPQTLFALMAQLTPEATDYQVRQHDQARVEVALAQPAGRRTDDQAHTVEAALDDLLQTPGATRVAYVDRIPLAPSGKLRHIVTS